MILPHTNRCCLQWSESRQTFFAFRYSIGEGNQTACTRYTTPITGATLKVLDGPK